jgi:hypothetical protein
MSAAEDHFMEEGVKDGAEGLSLESLRGAGTEEVAWGLNGKSFQGLVYMFTFKGILGFAAYLTPFLGSSATVLFGWHFVPTSRWTTDISKRRLFGNPS